jgi:hypothetical protein
MLAYERDRICQAKRDVAAKKTKVMIKVIKNIFLIWHEKYKINSDREIVKSYFCILKMFLKKL